MESPITPGAVVRRRFEAAGMGLYHYGIASDKFAPTSNEQLIYQFGGPQPIGDERNQNQVVKLFERLFPVADKNSYLSGHVGLAGLSRFADGKPIEVIAHSPSPEEAMARADKLLGQADYNPLTRNCEHYANWVAFGTWKSKQGEAVTLTLIVTAGCLLTAALAKRVYGKRKG